MACLNYKASDVPYKGATVSRKQLINLNTELIEAIQEKLLANKTFTSALIPTSALLMEKSKEDDSGTTS